MKTRLLLKTNFIIAATFSAFYAFGVEKVVEFDFTSQYSATEFKNSYKINDSEVSDEVFVSSENLQASSITHDGINVGFSPASKFSLVNNQNDLYSAILKFDAKNDGLSTLIISSTNNSDIITKVQIQIQKDNETKPYPIFLFKDEDSYNKFENFMTLTENGSFINNGTVVLYTIIPQDIFPKIDSPKMFLLTSGFGGRDIYKITVTLECEEGGGEEGEDEEEEIVVEEHDPLKDYAVGADVNLGLLQVIKSGDKYIYATDGEEYYILTSANAACYGAKSEINAVGTKVIDETLQLPVVQLAETAAIPTLTDIAINDITAEMMFKYVELSHVNIANGEISNDNGSIAINDIFGICPDSKSNCNVIGIVAKKPAAPSQAPKRAKADTKSELAIIPTEVISNSTISSAPVAPKDSNIKVKGSSITVADCADYEIIDLNGRIIARNRPATNCAPGLYFVKTPSTTHKVLIK